MSGRKLQPGETGSDLIWIKGRLLFGLRAGAVPVRTVGRIILVAEVATMTGPGVGSRPTALFPPQTAEVAWFRLRAAASLAAFFLCAMTLLPAQGASFRVVAAQGRDVLRDPRLAEGGAVHYMRTGSVWALYTEQVELVRVGSPAPWNPALSVTFLHPAAGRYGGLLYQATVSGPGITTSNRSFALLGAPAGHLVLAQSTVTPAPGGGAGVTFNGAFGNSLRLSQGKVSLLATLDGGNTQCNPAAAGYNCEGIWYGGVGSLFLRARAGDAAPGFGVNHVLHRFSDSGNNFAPVSGGVIAFIADVRDTVGLGTTKAIYRSASGAPPQLLAKEGDAVPGGGTLSGLQAPSIDRHGRVAFLDNNGLYVSQAIGFRVLARRFGPAPGGGSFNQLHYPAMAGHAIAFKAELQAFTQDAIVLETDTQALSILVREGDVAPNVAPNVAGMFDQFRTQALVNACGQVAFLGLLEPGGGITSANDAGIWVYDALGNGELIVREGQSAAAFGFAPHSVSAVHFLDDGNTAERASLDDGGVAVFDDQSQLVFTVELSNGTDLVVAAQADQRCDHVHADGFEQATLAR